MQVHFFTFSRGLGRYFSGREKLNISYYAVGLSFVLANINRKVELFKSLRHVKIHKLNYHYKQGLTRIF